MNRSYAEAIQDALTLLNDKGGSSRQQIWKSIEAHHPNADYK
jgi:hypothetical protein